MHTTNDTLPGIDRPEWLTPDDWPFALTPIRSGDHVLAVTDTGGDGPPLLLVHVGMWSFVWGDVLVALRDRFRCVTFDAPASGFTEGPRRAGIADAADAVDAVVRSLDLGDLTLGFHDLGGTAALDAAGRWPERVRGLVAVNTFAWRPSGAAFRGMLATMGNAAVRESDAWTGWLPRMTSTGFGVGRHWSRSRRRVFRRGMDRRGRRSFHRAMASVRRHDYGAVDRSVAALADRPLLTVFGERNDPLGFQPLWRERFADIEQVVVPRGNHFPMCDDPDLVAAALAGWHQRRVLDAVTLDA